MNTLLEKRMREIIKERLSKAENYGINSEEIYEQLHKEGFTPTDNAMKDVFDVWFKKGMVRGSRLVDRDAFIKHGSAIILKTFYGF
jgi:hypothetical protein